MPNNVRIILDTNLWISFLISKDFSKLDKLIFEKNCVLLFSEELLNEFLQVIKRPKFRRFFSQENTEEILETINEVAEFINIKSTIKECRDIKDNFLLSLSKDQYVDFLITGDSDLLEMKHFENTTILTISEFLQLD